MGLALSWWKFFKTIDLTTWFATQHLWKAMWVAHMEVQESAYLASNSQLGSPASDPQDALTSWILSMTFPFLYPYYIYPHYPYWKEAIQKKTLEKGFYNTHPVRENHSSLKENPCSLLSFSSPIVIPWEEICTQTQTTHIQSVESVLELGKY